MRPVRDKAGAIAARQSKARRVQRHVVKPAPKGWYGSDEPEVIVEVREPTSLDDLSDDLREQLETEALRRAETRIGGSDVRPKLSHTFEEAAQALGIYDKQEIEILMKATFRYVAQEYRNKDGRNLSALQFSVIKALIEEDNTSEHEIRETDYNNWGRRFNNTFKAYICMLRHSKDLTNTVDISSKRVKDKEYKNGVPYTFYFLTEEFKAQLIKDAVTWDAWKGKNSNLSHDIHERIASLDNS